MKEWPRVEVRNVTELSAWLKTNGGQDSSICLVTAKKGAGEGYIPYGTIVETALAYGWVDSLPRALDARRSMLLLSPRRPGSAWSAPNRERVARLIADGRMTAAGLAKVDAAKADGSWSRLEAAEAGTLPDDLRSAFDGDPEARRGYDAFTQATRRRILENLLAAKRPETRAKRIAAILSGARDGRDPLAWVKR